MSRAYIAYGYIQALPDDNEFNSEVLVNFPYDADGPFRPAFSLPRRQFRCSIISFAGCENHLDSDYDSWIASFESLLSRLRASNAIVNFDCEDGGDSRSVSYLSVCHEINVSISSIDVP